MPAPSPPSSSPSTPADAPSSQPEAHHVGITVDDLDTVLPFYRDVLGLSVVDEFSVAGDELATAIDVADASGTFVHLEGQDGNGSRIELVSFEPAARDAPAAGLNQPGATHIGLQVGDLDSFYANLDDEVTTLSEPRTTDSGTTILFLRDPEGNLVEVLES
ncbi:glyoxalase domain protein [Natrialba magadii ATCC 43099]|uniref:Glyoxalase domain protein n=1 Tax=Natrialba magadii (strain ATCC 43099 / DSM 3394 / CCM 3739 / CIP 104546 / IAM 13178 / JCM 8861 / NBRC 102185 / NCIMB 2190 / MS3) TaxID=547559 RepID=D3SWJ5_NATMM|nr:VOC family protein [Natrialba magadii]ADD03787.1 glyoxalase domain protein [Natrialba magadii ATCC 43099]ELY33842.1 glyoxalase/bleomycin resistance protein/dioxygenase [Natrialba magadii ATCC 43099]